MPKQSLAILAVIFAFAAACALEAPNAGAEILPGGSPVSKTGGVVKGFGISPQGFPLDYSHFGDFLEEVGGFPNGGVMFNGAWRNDVEGGTDAGVPPETAVAIVRDAADYGYTPVVVFGWRSDDGDLHLSLPANLSDDWTNQEAQVAFESMLVEFAGAYHPPYIFLGNESDAYYMAQPEDYSRWVEFYNRAYASVKAVSPETLIGPIFQFERLSGQGALNNWNIPYWGALEAHDLARIDILGITLYPWLAYRAPDEIPDDYLAPLLERIGELPLAITETGWPGENLGLETPWEQSPEAQLAYIEALDSILDNVHVEILNWLLLHPMARLESNLVFWQTFGSLSLRDAEGNKRPAYDAWADFQP
jgi:hypothetical protein